MANRLSRLVATIEKSPSPLRNWLRSRAIGVAVKLLRTTRTQITHLSADKCQVTVLNRRRNQNHIGSVHACGMALAAETATGMVVGMNVPDDRVPVIKSMHIDFVKRSSGDITARAHLTDEQRQLILEQEKGDVIVPCTISDSKGVEPIEVTMTWAWTPKRRS